MPIKRWILDSMNRMNGPVGRSDLPRRSARAGAKPRDDDALRESSLRGLSGRPQHLGAYAPLIAAIRDELEHFVSSQLRLHLAIAERDRYLLTSIDVECAEGSDGADLLSRFTREFTPEQIKRFLARDVIGHLPNAGSIDLSQFAGLNVARAAGAAPDDDGYADLRAQLSATARQQVPHAFEVTLVGRWTETDAGGATRGAGVASPATPLAGSRLDIKIEDADGTRHMTLASVIPNRRYAIGTGDGCDVAVNGTYASRRHCEVWLENGRWWAADAGSTNGIRVEAAQHVLGRAGGKRGETPAKAAIEVVAGARIVLSAHAKGKPADYPHLSLEQGDASALPATPVSDAPAATTPVTPIVAPLPQQRELTLTTTMTSGERSIAVRHATLPISVGRSRSQDLIVDWAHEGVSGHHVDITAFDDTGVEVVVHGDNGVTIAGVTHPPGRRVRWRLGERMTLGRASGDEPECALVLSVRP